ncbi:MAG: M56 family metallopeptidase [Caulobacteraceae bacterium]
MTEFIITSSVLILVVILLRHFLKGKISLRLQYALWALVLIRLIVPITLFESPISVMNAVKRSAAYKTAEQTLSKTKVYSDVIRHSEMTPDEAREAGKGTLHEIQGYPSQSGYTNLRTYIFVDSLGVVLARILRIVWLAGIAVVGLTLLLSNLSLSRKLRKTRIRYQTDNCERPVYLVENLTSPCLFGFFRPVIYITPDVAGDALKLRHVLVHEQTHYRHGDHIWAAMRGFCLALHWYNPLVWLAAALSRRDSELACDEGTIKHLGEASRLEYGRTIIGLTCEKRKTMDLLCCATTMTDGKKGIRERVTLIARKPKVLVPALVAVAK